jgi:uncharacterized membrane protein YeaQ/YmgE (transglycosylase-associated protein family)
MGLLSWIILGGIAGWIVSLLSGKDLRGGCLGLVLVGVIGAVIGGSIFRFFGGSGVTGVNIYSIVVAVVGALVLLWIVRVATGRRG